MQTSILERLVVLHEKPLHSAGMSQWIGLQIRPGIEPAIAVARSRNGTPAGGVYLSAHGAAPFIEEACRLARESRGGVAGLVRVRDGVHVEIASTRVVTRGAASAVIVLTLIAPDGERRRPTVLKDHVEIAALDAAAFIATETH